VKRIPKQFELGTHTVSVRMVGSKEWEALTDDYDIAGAVGAWVYKEQGIIILRDQTPSMRKHTFTHELTHAILDAMGDAKSKKLTTDEKWVDRFAGFLAQALETAK
jgi:Zn-dependent peptidase ImmA (M78 family)